MIYFVTANTELFTNDTYKIIGVDESLSLLSKEKMLQADSETDMLDPHLGSLLLFQLGSISKEWQVVIDCTTIDIRLYKEILESKYLIGHNLKFDLQWLYNYSIVPRKVYDTMIVEQLLYLGYPKGIISYSLQSVAKRRLDIYIDKTVRGQIRYKKFANEVIKYGADDVVYLYDIMILQLKECKEKECLVGAKLECDVVPAMAYLEWCGIKLDEDKWKNKMKKDKENLNKAIEDINNFVIKTPSLSKYHYYENSLFPEYCGERVTINWDSPKQVVEIAQILGFNTTVKDKKTGEEKDSVLEKHLSTQKGINDEFLNLYFKYQEYSKVVSSFGQGHLNSINPITGRLHTVYQQIGAASGRMSCGSKQSNNDLAKYKKLKSSEVSYPNMQQLPANEETRSSFVSENNNLFCSADYSALESRLGADIYQEHEMLKEFIQGSGDMHSLCAKMVFKEELKDIDVKDIKAKRPDLRKRVKSVEFSKQFGGSAISISQTLGCTMEEAEKFSKFYDEGFKGVTSFKIKGAKFVKTHGYVLINKYTGHKMYWWDFNHWLKEERAFKEKGFWDMYREAKAEGNNPGLIKRVKEHFKAGSKWERMALNAPTQGCGSNIIKAAITNLFDYIVDNKLFNVVKLCAVVHDECCIEYPKSIPYMNKVLENIMEEAAAKYCKSLPIPAEASVGVHWIH